MHKIKIISIITIFLLAASCSSDSTTNPNPEPVVPAQSLFTWSINGVQKSSGSVPAYKTEDNFSVSIGGIGALTFDKTGRFGSFDIDLRTGTSTITSKFYSHRDYSSHYFTFNLIALDEVNKRVKGNFSGYIFSNPFNVNLETKFVDGNFDVEYIDLVPSVTGFKNQAKIDGVQWSRTFTYLTRGAGSENQKITQHDVSNDEYKIMIDYHFKAINLGIYNFLDTDPTNKVQLAKFDPVTATYTNYISSGTLIVTKLSRNCSSCYEYELISGTYSFTAVNPNNSSDVIQVTDGTFKLRFISF